MTTDRGALDGWLLSNYGRSFNAYLLCLGWAVILIGACLWFVRSSLGLLANAAATNSDRLMFLGYQPATLRFRINLFSSAIAGGAGALSAILYEIVAVNSVQLPMSANVLLMTVVGGAGSAIGPLVGAFVLTGFQTVLSQITSSWILYYALIFIAVVLFAPRGVVGVVESFVARALRDGFAPTLFAIWKPSIAVLVLAGASCVLVEVLFDHGHRPDTAGLMISAFAAVLGALSIRFLAQQNRRA